MIKVSEGFKNKQAFIAYLMAGDPDLETSAEYILAAQDAGADIIKIGIPFSDPIAEGEIIEAASMRALCAGTRLDGVFGMVASLRDKMRVPMVFMTYLNPVFVYGCDRFFARCADIGISGVIIPDMPFEERGEVKEYAAKYSVDVIAIITPSSQSRVTKIARDAEGFIYLIPSNDSAAALSPAIAEIRKVTDVPVVVNLEVAKSEQSQQYPDIADGIIAGSDIVEIIGRHGKSAKQALCEYIVKEL